jgi:myo-inositol-1(or 4)-monophosphatase
VDRSSKFTWVIDPIDGTSNFAAGAPHWGIMIGLLEDATPIAGGMVMPMLGLTYLAERGKGATRNGKPISVTAEPKLSNVLVRYAMDAHPDQVGRVERECADLARITNAVRNVRNSGCDPCDGGYVAGGQYGATLNRTCKIWDCVAPQIVIEEAGGLFTAFDGSPMDYSQPLAKVEHEYNTCAASPVLHEQLQKIIHAAPVA